MYSSLELEGAGHLLYSTLIKEERSHQSRIFLKMFYEMIDFCLYGTVFENRNNSSYFSCKIITRHIQNIHGGVSYFPMATMAHLVCTV